MKSLKFFTFIFLLAFGLSSFAQNEYKYTVDLSEWQTFEEVDGIKASFKTVEYHDDINDQHKELYIIRLENKTDKKLTFNAKKALWYGEECFNCDSDSEEYKYNIELQPGETLKGDPVKKANNKLVIFKKFLNYEGMKEVTKFEFHNITVKNI